MFYRQYLSSLCQRRQWPEPMYQSHATRSGIKCVVRVNHREYSTDSTYQNDALAIENAAMRAYLICRNFSVNDGKLPSGKGGDAGIYQGLPVAIGTGRRSGSSSAGSSSGSYSGRHAPTYSGSSFGYGYGEDSSEFGSSSGGSRSGGSSPGSSEFPDSYRPRRSTGTSKPSGSRRR